MKYYVGIDLGGTNIVAGIYDENYNLLFKESTKTKCPRPAEEIVADIIMVTKKVMETANLTANDVESIGVGCPGTANKDTGIIEYSNNLDFHDVPLVKMMEDALGKKVYIENDANAAAYGEYLAGAGRDYKSLVAITLGTGVGGGVIINGEILTGFNFAGAELGHTVIVAHGRKCTCGREGCWEAYASATGLINMTKEVMEKNPDSKMWELCENNIEKANGRTSFDAMRAGDACGKEVVDMYLDFLSIGISDMINIFQPAILCIGGGISKEGDNLLKPLKELIDKQIYSRDPNKQTKIIIAQLGGEAGLLGAAFLGLDK